MAHYQAPTIKPIFNKTDFGVGSNEDLRVYPDYQDPPMPAGAYQIYSGTLAANSGFLVTEVIANGTDTLPVGVYQIQFTTNNQGVWTSGCVLFTAISSRSDHQAEALSFSSYQSGAITDSTLPVESAGLVLSYPDEYAITIFNGNATSTDYACTITRFA